MIHVGIWGYFYSVSTLIITLGLGKWGAQLTGKVLIKGSPLGCLPLFVISFLVWGYEHGRVWARYKAWLQEQRQLQSIRTWVAIRWRGGIKKKKKTQSLQRKKVLLRPQVSNLEPPQFPVMSPVQKTANLPVCTPTGHSSQSKKKIIIV